MAMHGHSAACCTIPPIQHDYNGKGKFVNIMGMNTYQTGPADAEQAVLFIFDIFGHKPQALQGADILANSDDKYKYQVFMPDFFNGSPADISWYPPDTDEKGQKLGQFFQTTANPQTAVEKVPQLVKALNEHTGGKIKKWAIVGFCWGGKITALSSQSGTPFTVAAVAHPAMVDPKDAAGIVVPFAMLPSKDEPEADVQAFAEGLKVDHLIETYPDQIHGFMGARGDLKDPNVAKNYQKGYETVLSFFHKHIG